MYGPTFEGAAASELQAFPFFSVSDGDRLSLGLDGLIYDVYEHGSLSISTRVGYDFGRAEDDDPHLAGLGDIDGGPTLGFGVDYKAGPVDLFAKVDRSFGDVEGIVGTFGADVSRPLGNVLFGGGVSATWADDDHMQGYFGVNAAQSTASGLPQYDAGAGFKRVDLEMSATYILDENWMLRGEVEVGELLGDAADSPITQDSTQTCAGLSVGYRF
jgi:MipA family protein